MPGHIATSQGLSSVISSAIAHAPFGPLHLGRSWANAAPRAVNAPPSSGSRGYLSSVYARRDAPECDQRGGVRQIERMAWMAAFGPAQRPRPHMERFEHPDDRQILIQVSPVHAPAAYNRAAVVAPEDS